MRRTLVQPADVSTALAELKTWLGISRSNEDDMLAGLLRAGLEACEAFTGQAPLSQTVEEHLPVRGGSYDLKSRPVRALLNAELVAQDGTRNAIDTGDLGFVLHSDGTARVESAPAFEGRAISLHLDVGLAADWATVPASLRQGLIRLAAFEYRYRDQAVGDKPQAVPPASVTALWRPWRQLRLA